MQVHEIKLNMTLITVDKPQTSYNLLLDDKSAPRYRQTTTPAPDHSDALPAAQPTASKHTITQAQMHIGTDRLITWKQCLQPHLLNRWRNKINVKGQLLQKTELKQMGGQTWLILLPSLLTRSVTTGLHTALLQVRQRPLTENLRV